MRTRRGRHHLYRDPGVDLGKLSSLKPYGLNADVKHGNSIVVAPPSRHAEERSFAYSWEDCDETVIRDLPPFNAKALQALLEGGASETLAQCIYSAPPRPPRHSDARAIFRDGSRKLGLNDFLTPTAWTLKKSGGRDCILDAARTWNINLANLSIEPMDDSEVVGVVDAIMNDLAAGKLEPRHGMRATCTSDADEVRFLVAVSRNGADAFALLQLLRAEHTARCLRGETFQLSIRAMVKAGTMGDWAAERYQEARDILLEHGFIQEVRRAGLGIAGEYILVDRVLTPSIAARKEAA